MKKATQREMFAEVIALAKENGRDDIVTFAEERIAVLDKKNASRKPSKTQVENAALAEIVKSVLTSEGKTVSEIQALAPEFAGLSTQKMSAIVKTLVDSGVAVKTTDKKKSLFSLAENVTDEVDDDIDAE